MATIDAGECLGREVEDDADAKCESARSTTGGWPSPPAITMRSPQYSTRWPCVSGRTKVITTGRPARLNMSMVALKSAPQARPSTCTTTSRARRSNVAAWPSPADLSTAYPVGDWMSSSPNEPLEGKVRSKAIVMSVCILWSSDLRLMWAC